MAYGVKALRSVRVAYRQLRNYSALPVTVIGATSPALTGAQFVRFDSENSGRWAKLNLDTLSPYNFTLYLDADTRVKARDIETGFDILDDGFDLVMTYSQNQDNAFLAHSTPEDRDLTINALQNPQPLQLQAGVMWFRRLPELFAVWRREWERMRNQDQGALLRALDISPVKLWLLGPDWNSRNGDIIEHHFGEAR